jgi:chitin synthase
MNIHTKKNILFTLYILYNLFLVYLLFVVRYGILYTSLFLFASHLRDIFCVIYHIIHIGRITEKKPELKEGEEQTICCLVPVYAEKVDLVLNNIKSLCSQDLPESTKVFTLIICDGLVVGRHNDKPLFEKLDDLMTYEDDTIHQEPYTSWKTLGDNTLFYKIGEMYGKPIILAHKAKNSGKKDSLIVGEQLIEKVESMIDFKTKYNLTAPKYIYHTDSDTVADVKCLRYLLETFQETPDIDGVSAMVRAYYNEDENTNYFLRLYEKMFYIMQDFQYYFSLILRRQTESQLETTTCLPGCANMIKINDKSKKAIEEYAELPEKETNFLQAVTRMQGTDRRYTTLLLKQGAKLKMNWRASVNTEPPLGVRPFINQRRRWSSNAFFNTFIQLVLPDLPLYIRISSFIDITRLFSAIFRSISYAWFWIYVGQVEIQVYILLFCFVIAPYIYVLLWALFTLDNWPNIWMGLLVSKILTPFLSVLTISKMFLTASNFAWGGFVAKVEEVAEDIKDKVDDIIEEIKEECVELGIISNGEEEEIEIVVR